MDFNDFIEKLSEVKDKFKWTIGSNNRGIRGFSSDKGYERCYCPITAVCYATTGNDFLSYEYNDAAKKIGLNWHLADRIAGWADAVNIYKESPECKSMMATLGLTL